ncbi:hypothetical protein CPB83DRAFT_911296 [Crepidotus variabilis]|uniref:DNA-directed RNA polymerase n=1 Tax=Crepidotus variabilis TaxID=179855 RepID=A0A9P6E4R7_9AGAR|nr:hypothetical protein CPB83DRAFT_911296 [Crepidotus variabilis]
MIPRTGRRLQSSTCQFLNPTKRRCYSTPSKKANAAASVSASASLSHDLGMGFPPFGLAQGEVAARGGAQASPSPFEEHLTTILARPTPLTFIPPPVQGKVTSSLGTSKAIDPGMKSYEAAAIASATWYTDSKTIDMSGIIDACLHNLYDVQRANDVFKRLRTQLVTLPVAAPSSTDMDSRSQPPPSIITASLYNSFIHAYVGMAQKDEFQREYWLEQAYSLYDVLETGAEGVESNAQTYAVMMSLWWKLKSRTIHLDEPWNAASTSSSPSPPTPAQILTAITSRGIPIMNVISHPSLDSPDVMAEIAKVLSGEAVKLGLKHVLEELGEAIGAIEGLEISFEVQEGNDQVNMDDVPEVRPVLKEVKRKDLTTSEDTPSHVTPPTLVNLRSTLAKILSLRRVLPSTSTSDLYARQKHIESSVYEMAEERMKEEAKMWKESGLEERVGLSALGKKDGQLKSWIWEWHCLLTERIKTEVKKLDQSLSPTSKTRGRASNLDQALAPYLNLLPASVLSLLTILETMRMQGSGGVSGGMKTARALIGVGRAVEEEWRQRGGGRKSRIIEDDFTTAMANLKAHGESVSSPSARASEVEASIGLVTDASTNPSPSGLRWKINQSPDDFKPYTASWSQVTRSQLGAVLVEWLMDVAKVVHVLPDADKTGEVVSETQPAFYQSYEYVRGTKLGIIKLNSLVIEKLASDSLERTIHPRHLPMLIRPRSWAGVRDGAYITRSASAMRFKSSIEQELYLREATSSGSCSLVYAGLDILGSTAWKINKGVFETVLKVWNDGVRMGKVPPAVFDVEEPTLEETSASDISAMEKKRDHGIKHRQWSQAKANNHSDRCSVNYKIEIARTFLNDTFYLPHNLDFRGRAYPIPPHLNHIGDDLSRGLMKFADAKPLGERGLRWLKIHLAGLCGYDKAMFDERVKWVDERMDKVRDSALKPLDGARWWAKADDPWQALAACMELSAAYELPDPTTYESSLPIHQDGTCNGLQHYAALGGDATGAKQVNLAASDRPSDVYTYVALNVERLIEEDLKLAEVEGGVSSLSEAQKEKLEHATILSGKVSRKVVKQTVMTTVYGVTFVGAREQIERQLKDLSLKMKENGEDGLKDEKIWGCSSYLAKKVLMSIGETFSGAKAIQTWLNLCARLIAKSIPPTRLQITTDKAGRPHVNLPKSKVKKEQMTSVIWTTPLGLPIVQPYRKTARKQVMTKIQSVYISDPNAPNEVNSTKQASAFPPNFIHSLDATHMMLTALECRNQDIAFASVHDSYWTHGCDIDRMSAIIRDTFIALHSSDVLKKLNTEFRERYKGYKIPMDNISSATCSLVKLLAAAGTRIKVPRYHATSLKPLTDILEFTDDTSSSAGIADSSDVEESKIGKEHNEEDAFLHALGEGEEGYDLENDAELSSTKLSKGKADKPTASLLAGKFIDLTDLIPPLPDKGTFDVENIKKSQYFFS